MDYLFNKYILAFGSIMTPLIAIIMNHMQDSVYMLMALISLVFADTLMGVYIAARAGKLKSGKDGFWKIGDKVLCYFSMLIVTYTVVFLAQSVPVFQGGLAQETFKYLIIFTYSIMYGREVLSIFESIDVLQPKLLPKAFKDRIAKIFNKKLEELTTKE
jgi:phage-related holin